MGCSMNKRVLAIDHVCVAATVLGVVGCGSGTAATTSTAQPITTALPATTTTVMATSTTTPAPATTAGSGAIASSTATSLQATPTTSDYGTAMYNFALDFATLPTGSALMVLDMSTVTSADVQAASAYVTALSGVLDELKAIQPPAEVAATHQKLVDAMSGLLAAAGKGAQALQAKDQAALSTAQSDAQPVRNADHDLDAGVEAVLQALIGGEERPG